jgi:chromosome segregation ATPase
MSDLQETLKQLGDDLPKITQEMDQLVHKGAEAEKNADDLLKTFEQIEHEAQSVFHEIEQALAHLKQDAAHHLAELNQDLAGVEKGLEEVKTLEHTRDELKGGVEAAGHAMTSFQSKLQEGAEDLNHAHEEFKSSLTKVKEGVEEGHSQLEHAQQEVHSAGEALQHKVEESKNSIGDLIQNVFHNAMDQHLQETESKVTDFLSAAHSLGEQFEHQATDLLNNVVKAKSHEIMDEAKNKIEEELKQLMDKATDEICHAIEGMVEKVTGAKASSEEHKTTTKGHVDAIDEFSEPFKAAIDAVKGACETVGINFG